MKVTLKRSLIGRQKDQVATAKALGLKKIGDSIEVIDQPAQRGMVEKIKHLLEVSE
ncbi:50S ribosomal protein L30 [Deinococcus pimensis]|uniref:50S ribosomal protein L30 n=1 Tax=Deinococcus pimensis TaxID=309888 RepID=UPI0004899CB1|nr:50S ribosomal protein L30 [Deinococcus pimensis]